MCTCSREVSETGFVMGAEIIDAVSLPDSDVFAACQALCCRTQDCVAGDVQGNRCFLKKNAIGDNVRIERAERTSAFLC